MTEENKDKKRRIFDKVVMGAIIGGAIGSVIGASVRGKKDENIKEEVLEELKKTKDASKTILKKLLGIFRRKDKGLNVEAKEIPNEMEEYQK